ncbi:MAG TPA: dihydrofolate reductase family protein [Egicoccus sp.]|nr:dihydrofolate reductase family protein [Egicoccus sp.]HSK24676.1 dihydrofolate reductase family protein [Egicoccus sp.]
MQRPHVVTHVLLSVDGRISGFPPDVGHYYELVGHLPHDVVLTGSGTMVAAAAEAGVDLAAPDGLGTADEAPSDAPLLVVVDSGGRLTRFDWLRGLGYWRDVMVAGTRTTPASHLDRLRAAGVDFVAFGDDRVDLAALLHHLAADHGSQAVRVDAGPRLIAALLHAKLVDELSLLLAPYLAGPGPALTDALELDAALRLELFRVDRRPGGHLWLRYFVEYDAVGT